MATSDLINLIAAIIVGGGTLFLGIMAWRTICQTRSIQKAEKRERLLNEIIEWALTYTKRPSPNIFWNLADASSTGKVRLYIHAHIVEILEILQEMAGRNLYISKITLELGSQDLSKAVETLIINLEAYTKFLREWQSTMSNAIAKRCLTMIKTLTRQTNLRGNLRNSHLWS